MKKVISQNYCFIYLPFIILTESNVRNDSPILFPKDIVDKGFNLKFLISKPNEIVKLDWVCNF